MLKINMRLSAVMIASNVTEPDMLLMIDGTKHLVASACHFSLLGHQRETRSEKKGGCPDHPSVSLDSPDLTGLRFSVPYRTLPWTDLLRHRSLKAEFRSQPRVKKVQTLYNCISRSGVPLWWTIYGCSVGWPHVKATACRVVRSRTRSASQQSPTSSTPLLYPPTVHYV